MPPFVLTVLQIVFLILLYFFVYRAIRSVVVDIRGAPPKPRRADSRGSAPPARPTRKRGGGPPRSVVVLDERGTRGATIRLNGTLQVGRAEACQLQLSDTYASSFHARVFERDGAWFIEDLGSTNGTYLNQRRISAPEEVQAGDRVRIGKTTLEFRR